MSIYAHILKSPLVEVEKFNKHHDDLGRFTDSGSARSSSGHAGMTQTRRYGGDHAKPQGAVVEASNANRSRRNKGIHTDVNSHFGLDSNSKLRNHTKGGTYTHTDKEGVRHVQSVHNDETRVERQKSGVIQSQINKDLGDAAHMKAGLHGKNAVIFQSNPHAKAKDQTSKKIILHAGKGKFASAQHAQEAIDAAGLGGHAILHKTASGDHEIHIDIPKQHSAHGKGLRAMAVAMRRQHDMQAEHFNGERTLLRATNVDNKAKARLASNPTHAAKYDELKVTHNR